MYIYLLVNTTLSNDPFDHAISLSLSNFTVSFAFNYSSSSLDKKPIKF